MLATNLLPCCSRAERSQIDEKEADSSALVMTKTRVRSSSTTTIRVSAREIRISHRRLIDEQIKQQIYQQTKSRLTIIIIYRRFLTSILLHSSNIRLDSSFFVTIFFSLYNIQSFSHDACFSSTNAKDEDFDITSTKMHDESNFRTKYTKRSRHTKKKKL